MAARNRALGLALLLSLAGSQQSKADVLTWSPTWTTNGWGWWISNPNGSTTVVPTITQAFGSPSLSSAPIPTQPTPAATPVTAQPVAAASTPSPAPSTTASLTPVSTQPSAPIANGFINFGSGPYPDASSIATGNPQPWYTSPKVDALFGGPPTAAQQAAFSSSVLQLTQQAFQLSGINVKLTTDPTVSAAHTLSVVSGSSSIPFPSAIGTTEVGGNGFSFIDQEAQISSSVGQLEQIVAHNVAHELMLAFGVPEQYDQTGNYIDATNAKWSMITNPDATFSPSAAQAINQALQASNSPYASNPSLAQYAGTQPVPEPTTMLAWSLGLLSLAAGKKLGYKRRSAA